MRQTQVLASPLEKVLIDLGEAAATGCLTVTDSAGDQAEVYFKDGSIYSVFVPGRRAQLGARLIASGDLSPEALSDALDVQHNELQGWRLGELLVHLGYVERDVVEGIVVEQLKDSVAALLGWPMAAHKFRKGKKARQDVAPPSRVVDLLADLEYRRHRWDELVDAMGGDAGVPLLSARPDGATDVALSTADWAMLCKIDGTRTVAELAADCGFTVFEAADVVRSLMESGLVDVDLPVDAAVASVTLLEDVRGKRDDESGSSTAELAASVKKVTAALKDLFTPVSAPVDPNDSGPTEAQRQAEKAVHAAIEAERAALEAERAVAAAERAARDEAERAAATAEREAQRAAEQARKRQEREAEERLAGEVEAWLAHETWLADQRDDAEEEAWATHRTLLDAERASREGEAWLAHYQWVENDRGAREAEAWAHHATWLDAERVRAEPEAWVSHALWLDDRRAHAEPQAWADHETWLADRADEQAAAWEAERREAEPEAWADHETWLAERAAAQAAAWETERREAEPQAWADHSAWLVAERRRVEPEAWVNHV
ncbi:MAG TPA: DUF4388 domain-containing protein, partial [Actinomycetes bacterium]|nr:DUF4388 domain-containing protein [Actinomycetes bacterium]